MRRTKNNGLLIVRNIIMIIKKKYVAYDDKDTKNYEDKHLKKFMSDPEWDSTVGDAESRFQEDKRFQSKAQNKPAGGDDPFSDPAKNDDFIDEDLPF